MAEFLLEILCEEIPARMQKRAGDDLARMMSGALSEAGLDVGDARTCTGPRRLTYVADIPLRSPDISEQRRGPKVGAPEQAINGFLRGAGLDSIEQLSTQEEKKGTFYVANIETPGKDAADIIAAAVPEIMGNFPWPKSMKSGSSSFRWVRPLSSILCLLDSKVVPFEVGGVASGNQTQGHRRMGAGPFTVKDFAGYQNVLEGEGHVMIAADARKAKILDAATAACAKAGLELVDDPGLLDEVAGLAEWPVVILGDMDPAFLELPAEVIRLSMRAHQKYFAVHDPKTGKLAPNFIVVANQAAPDGGKAIAAGNSRVLSARLADAVFFQSEDAKHKLIDYYDKLDGVVFHKKLGSVKDKAERVAALARELAPKVGADPEAAALAAKLAKCDLVTNTVVEFTSLQGQIGRLMYEAEGGDTDVAQAIEEHYKPQGPSDNVPTHPVSVAVALADKLDTLIGFWAINEKPTGSKDPYALRRSALGVVRILLKTPNIKMGHSLRKIIQRHTLPNGLNIEGERVTNPESKIVYINMPTTEDLLRFIFDRLKVHLRDEGMRHDVIDAVYALGGDDLVDIANRITELQSFITTDEGTNLLAGYKRASNILAAEAKKGDLPDVVAGKGTQAEETALFDALSNAKPKITSALDAEDYAGAMTALAALRAPIDAFFDAVTVNSENADERANRLALLLEIKNAAQQIADFDKIEN